GAELVRRRPAYTVDLAFTLTVASERTAELFNLMAAVATFLNRNRWLAMPRDAEDASRGTVRWEMDADGEV
ncbi:transcription factor, partial [Myxococcus sp. AM011]|nr:transcription factor [Myxococcus sp. AM011]